MIEPPSGGRTVTPVTLVDGRPHCTRTVPNTSSRACMHGSYIHYSTSASEDQWPVGRWVTRAPPNSAARDRANCIGTRRCALTIAPCHVAVISRRLKPAARNSSPFTTRTHLTQRTRHVARIANDATHLSLLGICVMPHTANAPCGSDSERATHLSLLGMRPPIGAASCERHEDVLSNGGRGVSDHRVWRTTCR